MCISYYYILIHLSHILAGWSQFSSSCCLLGASIAKDLQHKGLPQTGYAATLPHFLDSHLEDTHPVQLYLGNSLLLAKEWQICFTCSKMKGENAGAEAQILHLGSYCSLLCHQDVVSVKEMHFKAPPPQARAQAPEVMNSDEFNEVLIRCTLVYIPKCCVCNRTQEISCSFWFDALFCAFLCHPLRFHRRCARMRPRLLQFHHFLCSQNELVSLAHWPPRNLHIAVISSGLFFEAMKKKRIISCGCYYWARLLEIFWSERLNRRQIYNPKCHSKES